MHFAVSTFYYKNNSSGSNLKLHFFPALARSVTKSFNFPAAEQLCANRDGKNCMIFPNGVKERRSAFPAIFGVSRCRVEKNSVVAHLSVRVLELDPGDLGVVIME